VFYTHGVSPRLGNFNRAVVIGPHCYLGSHCLFLPGAMTGPYTFVGAGSVVSKDFSDRSHVLLAGNPARVVKVYEVNARYFEEDHTAFLPSAPYRPMRPGTELNGGREAASLARATSSRR
jgi:serine acetyltransferase